MASRRCASIQLIAGKTVRVRCLLMSDVPKSIKCWLYTTAESLMIMADVSWGRSSQTKTRANSSAVLFVTLFVPKAVGRGCTRESKGIVGRFIHGFVGCELFIVVIVTLSSACAVVG